MDREVLQATAAALVAQGKGILAMDESTDTIGKRLQGVALENSEANRIAYRHMLLDAPGLGEFISGAILYDETIRQSTREGTPFPELMRTQGMITGIKVDTGAKALALHPGEKITEGLDGLRQRLIQYKEAGARFSKWRAVITIGDRIPTAACIEANAHALARYAALCQEAGLVPIVEPEVLMNGNHSIERCYDVTVETQHAVFDQLDRQGVAFEGIVLKPSMVLSGAQAERRANVEQVAEMTLRCLRYTVPAAVPGIAFLSGGQSDEDATAHLNQMNVIAREMNLPWRLTFSYARALQHQALQVWHGDAGNIAAAQQALLHRARLNAVASLGRYHVGMEREQP